MSKERNYQQLISKIRRIVRSALPSNVTVAVVSKGDNELLNLDGNSGWHLPQRADGAYVGYHPATSAEAITHLESLRAKGADYLLFPSTALWWLDHYKEFRQHLERNYQVVVREEDACLIFALRKSENADKQPTQDESPNYHQLVWQIRQIADSRLPPEATVVVVSKGDNDLLKLNGRRAWHFPQREHGIYAGYYPKDSVAAIVLLEALRAKGADYLLFPSTALWWLNHYKEFRQHLERNYRVVVREEDTCLIFTLRAPVVKAQVTIERDNGALHDSSLALIGRAGRDS